MKQFLLAIVFMLFVISGGARLCRADDNVQKWTEAAPDGTAVCNYEWHKAEGVLTGKIISPDGSWKMIQWNAHKWIWEEIADSAHAPAKS